VGSDKGGKAERKRTLSNGNKGGINSKEGNDGGRGCPLSMGSSEEQKG